ncbi:MAG: TetR/AcrR family transcriptional regulator [Chromatiaceae bacterium]|nr:TetR/AcrR family transcriptional regulator [Chromatiaceae bacterium]MCP5422749.1 TetR/AcrR family transcriptional regulator [Chromatiaceae bacterium]
MNPPAHLHALSVSEQKRDAILAAALGEFETHGYRGTSMDRVAASAQVSKRTVYNHFPSKRALFDAIAAQLIAHVHQGSTLPYDPAQPIDVQLRRIIGQVVDLFVAPSFMSLARVTLVELIRSPELARGTYELFRERQTGLADWLAAAAGDGLLVVDDPVWAADQLFGMIKAFAFWPQILGDQPAPDAAMRVRIIESTAAVFIAGHLPVRA